MNPISEDRTDTVMVGTNAEVRAQVTDKDGNPIANRQVVCTSRVIVARNANRASLFENLNLTVLRTDADGYATFVFGVDRSVDLDGVTPIDAVNTNYVSSHELTVKLVGNDEIAADPLVVKFAAINLANITGVDAHTLAKNNGADAGWALGTNVGAGNTIRSVWDRNGVDTQYVRSQQVSSIGSEEHAVTFNSHIGRVGLMLPTDEGDDVGPEEILDPVTYDSGKYETYETKNFERSVLTNVPASRLQYATVNFGKLSLSKYSRFVVRAWIVNTANVAPTATNSTEIPLQTNLSQVSGEAVRDGFAVQIPIPQITADNDGFLYVQAVIESKGQVNTDVNEGFTVKNIVGVRRGTEGANATIPTVAVEGLSVTWEKDEDVSYTDGILPTDNILAGAQEITAWLMNAHPDCTYRYRMPAFPRTGNAIITVINSENREIAYYAVPTENKVKASNNGYENENTLVDDEDLIYQLSKDEAKNTVGNVTSDGNVATVNSEKTGITHVIGIITSTNPLIPINATNNKIYSSVHWNPIPTVAAPGTNPVGTAAAALVGQHIVLKAQLNDKNGNPVTTSGVGINFYNDDPANQITNATADVDGAGVVKVDTVTNALGQAELELVSVNPREVTGIGAQVTNNGNGYTLTYALSSNSDPVTAAWVDLYWVDANVRFDSDATFNLRADTSYTTPFVDTDDVANVDIRPIVGENWLYEVRASGAMDGVVPVGTLAAAIRSGNIVIGGLTIQTSTGVDSVGTVTGAENGKAHVTSSKAGTTRLVNELNSNSIPSDGNVTFTFNGTPVPYVGVGTPFLSKRLTLSIHWTAGAPTATFIIPTSENASPTEASIPVYLLVQDANDNPLENKAVTIRITGDGALVGADANGNIVGTTNEYGIVSFAVAPGGAVAGTGATISATIAGMSVTPSKTIRWVNLADEDPLQVTNVAYDITARTLTLTFNHNIYEPSVLKDVFKVYYGPAAAEREQHIGGAVLSAANKVTISLPGLLSVDNVDQFKVEMVEYNTAENGIVYNLVSIDGQRLEAENATITFKANSTKPDEAEDVTP